MYPWDSELPAEGPTCEWPEKGDDAEPHGFETDGDLGTSARRALVFRTMDIRHLTLRLGEVVSPMRGLLRLDSGEHSGIDDWPPACGLVPPIDDHMDGHMDGVEQDHMQHIFAFDPDYFNAEACFQGLGTTSLDPSTAIIHDAVSEPSVGMQQHIRSSTPLRMPAQSQWHDKADNLSINPGLRGRSETSRLPPQRTLPRRRSRYFRANHHPETAPIAIPRYPHSDNTALNPMERWQDSPPEAEAASLAAIADALKDALPSTGSSSNGRTSQRVNKRRGAYSTSGGTSASSISTGSSRSTTSYRAHSRASQRGRIAKNGGPRGRRGCTNPDLDRRPFQCTFCCDSFRTKYDWSRHETSLHLSLEKWVCTPHGGSVISQVTGRNHCAYCNMLDPAPEHLETHSHNLCHASNETHVFSRKDHLVQHLRLVHRLDTLPLINDWKIEAPPMISRCGFCNLTLHTWRQRADHLSGHFNDGKTMDDWQGGHGFEPSIQAQVMNALPPYALGAERRSFVPFSATCSDSRDHIMQMQKFYEDRQSGEGESQEYQHLRLEASRTDHLPPRADVGGEATLVSHSSMTWITRGMARFAQRQMRLGIIPTDAMFQDEARRLIYGSEDGWEQTIADNEVWLASFRSEIIERDAP